MMKPENLQDRFLNQARKDHIPVTLFSDIYGYNVKTDGGVAVFGQSVSDGALKTAKGLAF